MPEKTDALFVSRELSWLQFNRRVLSEAANLGNPPFERLKFLSITASNLDEFFMVRFAAIRARANDQAGDKGDMGFSRDEQLRLIAEEARLFMEEQQEVLRVYVLPVLNSAGVGLLSMADAAPSVRLWAESSFKRDILPKCATTVHTHKKSPFAPAGRALHLGLLLLGEKKDQPVLATLPLPSGAPRVWKLPKALGDGSLLIEDILSAYAGQLAPGHRVLGCWPFRVTRDEDFTVPDNAVGDLVTETKKSLQRRVSGDIVRLEVDACAPDAFIELLRDGLSVPAEWVYRIPGPLSLTFLLKELYPLEGFAQLRFQPLTGSLPTAMVNAPTIFDALRAGDIFLHHPYDSFEAVIRFVREAAADPRVLAIKQTLYRVSGDSPVIKALCDAAEAGKRVTVLLEVKARFDEENNIHWGELLEKSGCIVLYGLPRLKTHCKITLVTRREGDGLSHYVHLGTGNYNDVTAKQYTDMGLLTCDSEVGEDAQAFFNMITGFSREPKMKCLTYAPKMLRGALADLIEVEIEHAKSGQPCGIFAKMNSLVDDAVIRLLYGASRAGVPVKLLVRGVCCLRAGVPGQSETIEVRSLIGRFLEHSRVFRFENGGDARIFLSSADWMPRNLDRRLELMFPVRDQAVRERIEAVLDLQWSDTVKLWRMEPDGRYRRVPEGSERVNAQEMAAVLFEESAFANHV